VEKNIEKNDKKRRRLAKKYEFFWERGVG